MKVNTDLIVDAFNNVEARINAMTKDEMMVNDKNAVGVLTRLQALVPAIDLAEKNHFMSGIDACRVYTDSCIVETASVIYTSTTLGLSRKEIQCQLEYLLEAINDYRDEYCI